MPLQNGNSKFFILYLLFSCCSSSSSSYWCAGCVFRFVFEFRSLFALPLSLSVLPFLHFIPHMNGVEWIELDWIGVKWMRIWIKAVCCVLKWLVGLCVYLGGKTITILVNPLFGERERVKKEAWMTTTTTNTTAAMQKLMATLYTNGYKTRDWIQKVPARAHTHTHSDTHTLTQAVLFPTHQNYILVYIFLFKLSILTKWMTFVAQSHTNLLNSPHLQP